ncbi:MAG: VCBS repeat-containing protein [Saprospiraceae bacterium]|nr:VCBS repeat-containing protein [Saprospiraceae bacterium]
MKQALSILLIISWLILACNDGSKSKQVNGLSLQTVAFDHIVIDTNGVVNPWAKICSDIDGNGTTDIIVGGQRGPLIWYRNPDWQKFDIAAGGYDTVDGEAGDMDGDGDMDVVMGGLFWYENPGQLSENPEKSWNVHRIADHPTHDVELADINGDGRLDVITRNQSDFGTKKGNTIHLWTNLAVGAWDEKILECNHGEGLRVIDLDADGDMDIIGGGFWLENSAEGWIKHDFANWHASANLAVADLNNDNRMDIILTPSELAGQYYRISWFEQPSDLVSQDWTEHPLVDSIECVIHGVDLGDFNGDKIADMTYSEMHQGVDPDEVVVLINLDHGKKWNKILLSEKGSHSIQVEDFNSDGVADILGANWSGEDQSINLWISKNQK